VIVTLYRVSMAFNGISGAVNEPGELPWEVVVGYFAIALAIVFFIGNSSYGNLREVIPRSRY